MQYMTFHDIGIQDKDSYSICILTTSLQKLGLQQNYVSKLIQYKDDIIAYKLDELKTADLRREYFSELLEILKDLGTKYILVTDADYFKTLTKQAKAPPFIGYALPCLGMPLYKDMLAIYCPSWRTVFRDPVNVSNKIKESTEAIIALIENRYKDPGSSIIKEAKYPMDIQSIKEELSLIKNLSTLTVDIEGLSLKHYEAGISTITFCKNENEGIAFPVDWASKEHSTEARKLLKDFFNNYQGKLIFHNGGYDICVLIYTLYMAHICDYKGLIEGLDILTRNFEDTKIIAYLVLNSCMRPELSLKSLSQSFSGNYAVEDIDDITKYPLQDILQYNLIDGLSTYYVYNKYYPLMVKENQEDIYINLFKPALKEIIQMQLVGMPLDYNRVNKLKEELDKIVTDCLNVFPSLNVVKEYLHDETENIVLKYNTTKKVKRIKYSDVKISFNLNSPRQVTSVLYDEKYLGLPIINTTKTGLPSADIDTLNQLINYADTDEAKMFVQALIDFRAVEKIISTFLPPMLNSPEYMGNHFLFGNFNLGGTVSGRLSSSNPNLQQIPSSGSIYAKAIKKCFKAPKGWIFVGLDFDSLEDRISALTTKDENKLKIYTDGYDGHSLRAYSYFKDQITGIDPHNVESINSIAEKYKNLRQKSKAPTFALTYQGTWITLVKNCGFKESEAKQIERAYNELYKQSIDWVNKHLEQATKDGYVEVAFGLKVRTPLLYQVILGNSKTPYEALAEGRTAGNALGQSWGLLNTRAANEFMQGVRNSEFKYDIMPCAHIHDAQYYLVRNNIHAIKYVNDNLVKAVSWQEDPLIAHDKVKLTGKLSIFYPTWAEELTLPNNASLEDIGKIIKQYRESLK